VLVEEQIAKMKTADLKEYVGTMMEVIGDTYHAGNWIGLSRVCGDVMWAAREITIRAIERDVREISREVKE